jgi:hypothetical protein
VGVVEALATVENEVELALGDVRRQAANEKGADFFFRSWYGCCIGNNRSGGSRSGVRLEVRQLGEGHFGGREALESGRKRTLQQEEDMRMRTGEE